VCPGIFSMTSNVTVSWYNGQSKCLTLNVIEESQGLKKEWRRGRDSNPWYPVKVHTISNRAPSASSVTSPHAMLSAPTLHRFTGKRWGCQPHRARHVTVRQGGAGLSCGKSGSSLIKSAGPGASAPYRLDDNFGLGVQGCGDPALFTSRPHLDVFILELVNLHLQSGALLQLF
jgi:hypothetical protein